MSITFPSKSLDPRVKDAGILLNLLSEAGDTLTLNEAWFSDPFSADNIAGVGTRGQELINLAVDFIGEEVKDPPDDQKWYSIEFEGKKTGINLVVGGKDDDLTISIGMFYTGEFSASPKIEGTAFILFPMLTFTDQGWKFVLGDKDQPAKIVGEIKSASSFSVDGKTFSTLRVTGNFVLNLASGAVPSFEVQFVDDKGAVVEAIDVLSDLINGGYAAWINLVLATSGAQAFLDTKIGSSTTESIGSVLIAIKLLEGGKPYTVADLNAFLKQDPETVAIALLKEALNILTTQADPLIKIGQDGGIWVVKSTTDAGDRYGIRTTAKDVGKTTGAGADAKADGAAGDMPASVSNDAPAAKNKPQAILQIGKWFTGEKTAKESWLKRVAPTTPDDQEPGAYVYLLLDKDGAFSLSPRLELVSVGFDYVGGNDSPLIEVKGATCGGFEPRMYLSMDIGSSGVSDLSWAGGLRMDSIGLPLSGSFDTNTGDNPVASNLLASGEGEGGEAAKGKEDAVAPTFSVSAAGMDSTISVQLYGPDDAQTDRIWFPINRAFGPLDCKKIGIEWKDSERFLSTLFDGGVQLGPLGVELQSLSVGMKVTEPTNLSSYKLGLEGLGISYKTGSIEITGAFLRDTEADPVAYNGQAHVKAGPFGLGALGSYTTLPEDNRTSLFVFAFIDFPLGGPGFFFVTGLAGGFGYNRQLIMPDMDKVLEMPLVAALSDPSKIGGKDASPMTALAAIKKFVPPTRGQNFITAGIKFTTYKIVNSVALVAVQFGNKLEIDLLGVSAIKLPQVGPTFAYADLELLVVIAPDDGEFRASLMVGPESFVLDPKCKLTGGFAFFAWFGPSDHAGDFVVTLGGYHPAFTPPKWYPDVPRLGFNWPVEDSLTISGGCYFALTPSCAMGGGDLSVVYSSGGLKAWFTAHADFIIYWKPFYFDASIGVSLGASYTFSIFGAKTTASVSLGADLELYGPEIGGKVHVSWFIISFTIKFGAKKLQRIPTVDWAEFKTTLPGADSEAPGNNTLMLAEGAEDASADENPKVVSINVETGLLTQMVESINDGPEEQVWFVRPDEFVWYTKTTVPATKAMILGKPITQAPDSTPAFTDVAVRPMGIKTVSDGSHTITIDGPDTMAAFDFDLDLGQQPEAMWGKPQLLQELVPTAKLIKDCIIGVGRIRAKPHPALVGPPVIDAAAAFTFIVLDPNAHWLPISPDYKPPTSGGAQPSTTTLNLIHDTLMQDAQKRSDVFAALSDLGVDAGANGDLAALAANPTAAFAASPMIGSVA